jgi:hypothetical protein
MKTRASSKVGALFLFGAEKVRKKYEKRLFHRSHAAHCDPQLFQLPFYTPGSVPDKVF